MIKTRLLTGCVNNNTNIIYILKYHSEGIDGILEIFNKTFEKNNASEYEIKLWMNNLIFKNTGLTRRV